MELKVLDMRQHQQLSIVRNPLYCTGRIQMRAKFGAEQEPQN